MKLPIEIEVEVVQTQQVINVTPQIGAAGGVSSVNGQTGTVILTAEDIGAYPYLSTGIPKNYLSDEVQNLLDKADTALQVAPVASVDGRRGEVQLDDLYDTDSISLSEIAELFS